MIGRRRMVKMMWALVVLFVVSCCCCCFRTDVHAVGAAAAAAAAFTTTPVRCSKTRPMPPPARSAQPVPLRRRMRTTTTTPVALLLLLLVVPEGRSPAATAAAASNPTRPSHRIRDVVRWRRHFRGSRSGAGTALKSSNPEQQQEQQRRRQEQPEEECRHVVIIGAGWGGLSAAHALSKGKNAIGGGGRSNVRVTLLDASPRVGGLVRDGYSTLRRGGGGGRTAEAGQHGFWNNYVNLHNFFANDLDGSSSGNNNATGGAFHVATSLTQYAEQGQYSAKGGLEAVWPVFRDQPIRLPTGMAQAVYTRFYNLPFLDRMSALPLVAALSDFDNSHQAWERYDRVSFRDLCQKLGVSERCYAEAFEPMILTGLFAPGAECSAAAALGMAYFFVLQNQCAFDVQWARGDVGRIIFDPWCTQLRRNGVEIVCNARVTGFEIDTSSNQIVALQCTTRHENSLNATTATTTMAVDEVIVAVGANALNAFVRFCPELAKYKEWRGFANLRGTSVLATRLFLDRNVTVPYSANACWGFDAGIGMTMFDIKALHGKDQWRDAPGAVIEVDYYHASPLLTLSDEDIVVKVKADLDTILGPQCKLATVVDAAVVRLPDAVNWYFAGSYSDMPQVKSKEIGNLYFAGDIVRTGHGSWSQEKAFVTGVEAANMVLGRPLDTGVLPISEDEAHVKLGRTLVAAFGSLLGRSKNDGSTTKIPFLVDFL
jgi:uncharacterized protein with NAD-binding domain and iron-sulfur cluster